MAIAGIVPQQKKAPGNAAKAKKKESRWLSVK
jgi:hypothetical protein